MALPHAAKVWVEAARLGAGASGEVEAEGEDIGGVEDAAGFDEELVVDEEDGKVFADEGGWDGGVDEGVFVVDLEGEGLGDEEAVNGVAEFWGEG